jgi:hypothetical protein
MEKMIHIHNILVENLKRIKNVRINCVLQDNIKLDLIKIGYKNVKWIYVAEEWVC